MKNNFDYWIENDARKFLRLHWLQYAIFYLLTIWLSLRAHNLFYYIILGFLPYLPITIFRRVHNPINNIEDGIKKYNAALYERLSNRIPDKYVKKPEYRAGSIYGLLIGVLDSQLDTNVLTFRKNYRRINLHADTSLAIWFFTCIALAIYLYSAKS